MASYAPLPKSTQFRRLTGTFNVLTIIQPGPLLGGLDGRLVSAQTIIVWPLVFVHEADDEVLPRTEGVVVDNLTKLSLVVPARVSESVGNFYSNI